MIDSLRDNALLRSDAYIDGAWVGAERRTPVVNPATGQTIAQVADLDPASADTAIAAAQRAQPAWRP